MESYRLWGRIIRHHRIAKSETVPIAGGDLEGALLEICRRFDVQRPLQLPKHERDLEAFGRTFYSREHFTEPIDFQKLEIEFLEDDDKSRRSSDPRNQFDGW